MRLLLCISIVLLIVLVGAEKKRKRYDGDFEFADEDESRMLDNGKTSNKKKWILLDPDDELCRPLKCKKREVCVLADSFSAICSSKKSIQRKGQLVAQENEEMQQMVYDDDQDDDDDVFYDGGGDEAETRLSECNPCPVTSPEFICGSDNRTYSSICRMDYHNCIHDSQIRVACKGFCPCKKKRIAKLRSKKYKFTPEEMKHDNKHYKYIKYTKYNTIVEQKRKPEKFYNDVLAPELPIKQSNDDDAPWESNEIEKEDATDAPACAMDKMADRLIDWFSVLIQDEATNNKQHLRKGTYTDMPKDCKPEIRWMFQHLDQERDGQLSQTELYALKHDAAEKCLGTFVTNCDKDGDEFVSAHEWCSCLFDATRPCAALRRVVPAQLAPACDSLGYYRPLQCRAALGQCWCVDPHGIEITGSRTKGRPHCPDTNIDVSELILDDEDSDLGGSGDSLLEI